MYGDIVSLGETQFYFKQARFNSNGYPIHFYTTQLLKSFPDIDSSAATLIISDYLAFNIDGRPSHLKTVIGVYSPCNNLSITDDITYDFIYFDTSLISASHASRTDTYGTNSIVSPRFYDANNALNAVQGINNPYNSSDQSPHTAFFDNSLDGRMLKEFIIALNPQGAVSSNTPTIFYHDANRNIVAELCTIVNSNNQTQTVLQLTPNPVQALNISDLTVPSTVVQPNDNWATLSYRLFNDPNYASILRAYSGVHLAPGQLLNGRQIIDAYNKARDYSPYQQLIAVIHNNLNPALQTPQPPPPPSQHHHESFWDELIGAITAVIVMIIVPPAIAGVLPGFLGVVGTGIAYAAAGALSDAISQCIAIAFDDRHGFSVSEMFNNAIATGLTAGISKSLGIDELLKADKALQYAEAFAESVSVGLTVQLAQMAFGLRKQLDLKAIVEQAAATILAAKIDTKLKRQPNPVTNAANELANASLEAALHEPVDLRSIAVKYAADECGDAADVLANNATPSAQSSSPDHLSKPSQFSDQVALPAPAQTVVYSAASTADDNDPMTDLYATYQQSLASGLQGISAANVFSLTPYSVQPVASISSRVANDLYRNQNHWWDLGIVAFAAAMNSNTMNMFISGLNADTRHLMGFFAGNAGRHYFDDLQNGTGTFSDAVDFFNADVGFQAIGELGGAALGLGMQVMCYRVLGEMLQVCLHAEV